MKTTKLLSLLLALVMVLGMLPVAALAAEPGETPAVAAEASAGVIDGWQSYNGSTWLNYGDSCMNVTSQTNPGTVFFADRKFENYEMEVQMQLNSGPWFGVMYRAIGDEKGLFTVRPGSGAHNLSHHITKDGDGWQSDGIAVDTDHSQYTTGTVMTFKVRVENNKVSIWTKMSTDTDYVQEINNVSVPDALRGEGYVGICMQVASSSVHSVRIQDLDSDYTYNSNFGALSSYEGAWNFDKGAGNPTIADGVFKPGITNFDTLFKYKGVSWKNMVLETEFSYSANYAGLVFRGNGSYNGAYVLSGTETTERKFYYLYQKNQTASLTATYMLDDVQGTAYTYGDRIKLRLTVQDNVVSIEEMVVGKDADWVKTVEGYDLAANGVLGTSGEIGFYSRKGADLTIYNLKVTDTDTGYCYKAAEAVGAWVFESGSGSPTIENGALKPNITSYSTFYKYNSTYWKNYVLETEVSYAAQYAGVIFRGYGDYNGYYSISSAGTSTKRALSYWTLSSDKGTELSTVAAGSAYTYGAKIKLRITVQDNKLTIEEQIAGVDTGWVKTVDGYSIADNAAQLGTAGTIGFYTRTGADLTIYNLKVTDTDTGYCYKAIDPVGEWEVRRGAATITPEDEQLTIAPSKNPTVYIYSDAIWDNYTLEAEYSVSAYYGAIILRTNGTYNVMHRFGSGSYEYRGLFGYNSSGNAWNSEANRVAAKEGYTPYSYGDRVKVRYTVKDNLLTVQTMIVGKDTEWFTEFENYDLTTYDNGALTTSGEVGFLSRTGATVKVYAFKITDTDTGYTYDMFAKEQAEPTENTDSVVFDGNHVIDTSAPLTQTPETVELWFKTASETEQGLLSNHWSGKKSNEWQLSILESGKLYYHEDNPDSKMGENVDFRIYSAADYHDGKWHKAVIRRYYDEAKGIIQVDLSVYTDNQLVDRSTQTNVIGDTKKTQYTDGVFVADRILQIGTKNDNRYVFNGEIGEIRMWSRALTDEEAASGRIALTGTEEGLLHCFVPENGTNLVDLVTSKTDNEITADLAELWMEDYLIGDADWRIAVLPDIQHNTEAYEIQLRKYFAWVRDNAEAYNIKLVMSVGDMVNTCTPEQMAVVSEAASVLDGVVPFMPLMGNHDYPNYERDFMLWNEYFPYAKYSQYDYFGGAFEEGRMDNYYYIMNIHGEDYLFMGLEVCVRPAVAQWANEVIASHSNHKVIIVTHAYLSVDSEIIGAGTSDSNGRFKNDGMEATELYDCLISQHDNILLMVSGHVHHYSTGRRTDVTASGHIVNSLGFDTAQIERYYGTAGMVDFLGFTDGSNTVQVNSYSTERGQFFKSTDQFTIELDWDKAYPGKPADPEILVDATLAQKIADAKIALYSGNANAYVAIAGSASQIVTDKTYTADAKLNVFGQNVSAWYAEGGNVYVHILALGAAETVTLKGATDVMLQTNAFTTGTMEVVTPADINNSRYDYLLHQWNATISNAGQLGLNSAKAVGENTIVYFDGAYRMIPVSQMLGRNVAAVDVAGENWSGEIAVIEGDTFTTATLNITCQGAITVDGDLSDWNANILATGRTMTGIGNTSNKNVTFYAYMADEGLYVAAMANHSSYVDSAAKWYDNTNLEFYLNGESVRLWLTANPACSHEYVQDAFQTQFNGDVYTTVAEGFIAMEDLPENALSGELNIGFAWKTPGDNIKYYNMTSGYDWWYLTRRHASKLVEQYFVNASGIGFYSNVRTVGQMQLDGDFSDFNQKALENKLTITSQDGTVGFDAVAQYVPGYGVYVGVQAQSKTNPRPDGSDTWHYNTNLEFYIGENKYYITNRGAAVGNGLYAKNVYWHQSYDAGTALYTTTMEFFIPASALGTVNNEDYLRMGFAFKPTGESVLLNGHTEATDYWHLAGHGPSDTANQFYVYPNGIYLEAQADYVPYAAEVNGVTYDSVQAAVDAANGNVVKLLADSQEEITADDLYLDLNGHSLAKVTVTGTLYGMDSATNGYTASGAKIETLVGEYATHYRHVDAKRYMAIAEDAGVSFHRFYMGITNVSLAPAVTGFGYKAEFYGDEAVQAKIASVGYNLWLTEDLVVTRTADFKNVLTLRLKNFDVKNYGQAAVNASVMITLTDGTVIESGITSYSMRQMLELIANDFDAYTMVQKKAVQTMCLAQEATHSWNIANILNWIMGASLSTNYFTETTNGQYTLTTNSDAQHLVDDVLVDGEVGRYANYSVKGTLTLTEAENWGQARILVSADARNEYFVALEKLPSGKYQIFTMSKAGEESWNHWQLIDHGEQNRGRNSIPFEVIVIGDSLSFLIGDKVYYTSNSVSMTQSTVKFTGYNVGTTTVADLDLEVFEDAATAQAYADTKLSRYGETFGSSQSTYWTTNGVDTTNDRGETPVISVTGGAPQYAYVNDVHGDQFCLETEINVQAVLNNDGYPKFGLLVNGASEMVKFFVDMKPDLTATHVGVVYQPTGGGDDWAGAKSVAVEGMSFAANDTIKLKLIRNGQGYCFYVNDVLVLSDEAGFKNENGAVGIFSFNAVMTASNYRVLVGEEALAQQ